MMTPPEREVVEALGEAWNKFLELDEIHPMDKGEFASAVHRAQNIVMARAAREAKLGAGDSQDVDPEAGEEE